MSAHIDVCGGRDVWNRPKFLWNCHSCTLFVLQSVFLFFIIIFTVFLQPTVPKLQETWWVNVKQPRLCCAGLLNSGLSDVHLHRLDVTVWACAVEHLSILRSRSLMQNKRLFQRSSRMSPNSLLTRSVLSWSLESNLKEYFHFFCQIYLLTHSIIYSSDSGLNPQKWKNFLIWRSSNLNICFDFRLKKIILFYYSNQINLENTIILKRHAV